VVLLWPNVPNAVAAEGSFTYSDAAGVSKTSANPPDDSCIALIGSGQVSNNTNVPVGFYQTKDCKDRVATVDEGDSGSVPQYASIMFSKDNKPEPERRPEPRKPAQPKTGPLPAAPGLGGLLGG
jgi:hypothetical protein